MTNVYAKQVTAQKRNIYTLCPKNAPGLTSCNLAKTERVFNYSFTARKAMSYNIVHHTLSMLLQYLGKWEVQIW